MNTTLNPLGKVLALIEASNYTVAYAYDDLVFSDHSLFIFRFDDSNKHKLSLYINTECDQNEAENITLKLIRNGNLVGIDITITGTFNVIQVEDKEELEITFLEN